MQNARFWTTAALVVAVTAAAFPAVAHNNMKKSPSPAASVTQEIATAKVTVNYCRPGVKDREIWNELVPYGKMWSPGANAATTFEFETDMAVNGNVLPAGKYSFHVIPDEKEWTVIFNKNAELFRSLKYDEAEDALRFTVTPEKAECFEERLRYGFENLEDFAADAFLHWENLKISFHVERVMEE